jgi:hypothetical protein
MLPPTQDTSRDVRRGWTGESGFDGDTDEAAAGELQLSPATMLKLPRPDGAGMRRHGPGTNGYAAFACAAAASVRSANLLTNSSPE